MSLLAIRATTDANTAEQKRQQDRKKNILVLIHQYLIENGYVDTAERFQSETNGITTKYAAADNVDLTTLLIDFEAYYEIRFDKKPKVVRKLNEGEEPRAVFKANKSSVGGDSKKNKGKQESESTKLPSIVNPETDNNNAPAGANNKSNDFSITGTNMQMNTKGELSVR